MDQNIYEEFSQGIFLDEIKSDYLNIINKPVEKGAEGIIRGCTEVPILIKQEDCTFPLFETTQIYVTSALDFSLNQASYLLGYWGMRAIINSLHPIFPGTFSTKIPA
ncbi:MAG: hypothetical protein GY834_02455 [Bacteroidetes bacterium]|nr:hypothetical protein [Bacteroidota bacterium]